jgi:polysaccharide biosynthesis protein PslG
MARIFGWGSAARTPSCARAAIASLAAVATLLLAAAPASAELKPSFFGITPTATMVTPEDIAGMADAGAGTIRWQLNWAAVQRLEGAPYDWSKVDPVIREAARNNMRVVPFLLGSPSFAAPTRTTPPISTPEARAAWQAFVRATANRYGRDGAFWSANPALPYIPVRAWEIWNEPNLRAFWGGEDPASPSDYATLLRLADEALAQADPDARVLIGGLSGGTARDFMSELYRIHGIKSAFDGVGMHPYAHSADRVLWHLEGLRETMDRAGDGDAGIWVTEIGWSSSGITKFLFTTLQGQASNLAETYSVLTRDRRALKLRLVSWFTWEDDHAAAVCAWCADAGLLGLDDRPKPALDRYANVASKAAP